MKINFKNIHASFRRYLSLKHPNVKPWLSDCSHINYKHPHLCLKIIGKIDDKQFNEICDEAANYYNTDKKPLIHVWKVDKPIL